MPLLLPTQAQAHAARGAIFLEDAAEDDALIDVGLLGSVVRNVAAAVDRLLEDAKMELALATDIIGNGLGDGLEG